MSVAVRPFERRDRDQLTALVNLHVAAVIPGVVLSVNAVLSQLEREPYENVVDPWVAERLCKLDALDAGAGVLDAALAQMGAWHVTVVGAECSFPALACYGVPDTLPHIRGLLRNAGFGEPTGSELVLAADCRSLTGRHQRDLFGTRTLGLLGTRFTLRRDAEEVGFIEVCDHTAETARSSVAARWADVGNLIVPNQSQLRWAMPQLLSVRPSGWCSAASRASWTIGPRTLTHLTTWTSSSNLASRSSSSTSAGSGARPSTETP
jgi:hypothetical protein